MEIVKRLEIDAGHRLLKHEGKCRHVHGHRYAFEIHAQAPYLDDVGRVIDFSVIKKVIGGWLDDRWDHGFIAQMGDPIIPWLEENEQKFYLLDMPPTAENLSLYLLGLCKPDGMLGKLLPGILVTQVVCYETPTSRAVAT